jgi:Holliday junction resolvase RusA-like endonuclease
MKVLVEFSVKGFPPVPWSVPHLGSGVSKSGKRFRFSTRRKKSDPFNFSPSLEDWQELVGSEARKAYDARHGPAPLLQCPVFLEIVFFAPTPPGKKHGQVWYPGVEWNEKTGKYVKSGLHEPDLTNLTKAVEDALELKVVANDVQFVGHLAKKLYGPSAGIEARVWGIEASDYEGYGEPVRAPEPFKPARPKRSKPCRGSGEPGSGNPN